MRIYTTVCGFAIRYIFEGLKNAFIAAGHNAETAAKMVSPDFDLYLGHSGWDQNLLPAKNKRKGLVGIHVNPFGTTKVGSVDGGPGIDECPDKIEWVKAQEPDFVFCSCPEEFIPQYYDKWKALYPVISAGTAADIITYYPRKPETRFKCDIAWVGGKWSYKAKAMDQYLPPLMSKYKSLVYGGGWDNGQFIADSEVSILFASAKICPSVSEPHTIVHPIDLPERPFKVIASGGFTMHSPSPAIKAFFGDAMPVPNSTEHWMEMADRFIKEEDTRLSVMAKQRSVVLERNTYFDRCITIAKITNNKQLEADLVKAKQIAIFKMPMRSVFK